jgi:hypothetical protein
MFIETFAMSILRIFLSNEKKTLYTRSKHEKARRTKMTRV